MAEKKGLNYNPNTALIQGAADIGASMLPADMSGLEKVTQAGMLLLADATKKRQEVNKKLNDAAEASLSKAGGLSETDYNHAVDLTQKYKKEYLRGLKIGGAEGEKIKRQAMNNMVQLGNNSAEHKELNVIVAENIKNNKISKGVNDEDRTILTNMVNGDYEITVDEKTGKKIYNISGLPSEDDKKLKDIYKLQKETGKTDLDYDKWLKETYPDYKGGTRQLTHQEYIDLSNRLVDNTFENTYYDLKEDSKEDKNYFTDENNVKDIRGKILQAVPKDGQKFVDFLADDIQGQSFIELLSKDTSLENEFMIQIADLELSPPDFKAMIKKYDTDGSGKVSREEIIDAITNKDNAAFDLNNSLNIFADKMTNAAKNEHENYWAAKDKQRQDDIDSRKQDPQEKSITVAPGVYFTRAQVDDGIRRINNPVEGAEMRRNDGTGLFVYEDGNWVEKSSTRLEDGSIGSSSKIVTADYVIDQQGYGPYGSGSAEIDYTKTGAQEQSGKTYTNPKRMATGKKGTPSVKNAKENTYYENSETGQVYLFKKGRYNEVDPGTGRLIQK